MTDQTFPAIVLTEADGKVSGEVKTLSGADLPEAEVRGITDGSDGPRDPSVSTTYPEITTR